MAILDSYTPVLVEVEPKDGDSVLRSVEAGEHRLNGCFWDGPPEAYHRQSRHHVDFQDGDLDFPQPGFAIFGDHGQGFYYHFEEDGLHLEENGIC